MSDRKPLDIKASDLMIAVDALIGSLGIVGAAAPWKFSKTARADAVDRLIAYMGTITAALPEPGEAKR